MEAVLSQPGCEPIELTRFAGQRSGMSPEAAWVEVDELRVAERSSFENNIDVQPEEAAERGSHAMPRYLISFDANAMDHIPDEEMPAVTNASLAVVREAINAGVWVFGGADEEAASKPDVRQVRQRRPRHRNATGAVASKNQPVERPRHRFVRSDDFASRRK